MKRLLTLFLVLAFVSFAIAQEAGTDLLAGHPRDSYSEVSNIDAMEDALRKSLASQESYSFSRGWWGWDRLRARFVDNGQKDKNSLKILRAVFRGLIMDRHAKLQEKGEGDLLYLFYSTLTGDRKESVLDVGGRKVYRDVHGGGYHGGWGGAARMRIYEELANQGMLTDEEENRFREIAHQSLEAKFIDFKAKAQTANNHSFGNAGGVALTLKLFPEGAPQAEEAKEWLDRIWNHMADFGDWTEWTYYPYGPIFLHGMLDIAEATGRIETDAELINSIGSRCLGFIHGGGVRGNPNSGSIVRSNPKEAWADPWDVGYYDVETSSRDGNFWYRIAQHYKKSEYLWAAEQVLLGGRPPNGKVPEEYKDAYNRRFAWFVERGIAPKVPAGKAAVGHLSPGKKRIPERLYLNPNRDSGKPFASYFLYDKKDEHLDNVSGFLYEFCANGAKFLHSSGKYSNVYGGDEPKGGGTGEPSLDLLLVVHDRHKFPHHPNRKGDERDPMRRGLLKHSGKDARSENNERGDSFAKFTFDDYYGKGCRWTRSTVLTNEGYLIVADEFTAAKSLEDNYNAGPLWHIGLEEHSKEGSHDKNWFDAPALDHAWWQTEKQRLLLYFHKDGKTQCGAFKQRISQDLRSPTMTTFGFRKISGGTVERFLSVMIPHSEKQLAGEIVPLIETKVSGGLFTANIGNVVVNIEAEGQWRVSR